MPRKMDENDVALYRARYTIIYPSGVEYDRYFGPFRTPGAAKSAIRTTNRAYTNGNPEIDGRKLETAIEVTTLKWEPYNG